MKILVLIALVSGCLAAPKAIESLSQDSRIIGGTVTEPNEFNYTVSIQNRGLAGYSHQCSGVVYNVNWVVTTAQCADNIIDINNWRVVAGEQNFDDTSGYEQIRGITKKVISGRYNPVTYESDIAMLKLSIPLDLTRGRTGPAPFVEFQGEAPEVGANATITGWGALVSGGLPSVPNQHKATVFIVSSQACDAAYPSATIVPTMLCASNEIGTGAGPCDGDRGGPLIMNDSGKVVGLISWGFGCAIKGYPGVYTKLSFYLDWMASVGST